MAYTTYETISALSNIDPELKSFLAANEFPPRDFSDLKKLQISRGEQEKEMVKGLGPPPPNVVESSESIQLRDGHVAEELIWKPKESTEGGVPLVVLVHGGGYCMGSPAQLTGVARLLTALYGVVVVSVRYRLSPDYKFPLAPQDTWDGLVWAANNASSLGADLKKGFILGGVSAGAQMTAALAQLSLAGGLPSPLTGLWISVPVVLNQCHFDQGKVDAKYKDVWFSHEQNKDAPILDRIAIDAFMGAYQVDNNSPWATPFAAENPHKGMPKSYFQVCGMDPLRDDGLIYERVLKENGVETKLDVFPGLPHASWAFFPTLNSSKKIADNTARAFGWLLGTQEKGAVHLGAGGA